MLQLDIVIKAINFRFPEDKFLYDESLKAKRANGEKIVSIPYSNTEK